MVLLLGPPRALMDEEGESVEGGEGPEGIGGGILLATGTENKVGCS